MECAVCHHDAEYIADVVNGREDVPLCPKHSLLRMYTNVRMISAINLDDTGELELVPRKPSRIRQDDAEDAVIITVREESEIERDARRYRKLQRLIDIRFVNVQIRSDNGIVHVLDDFLDNIPDD